jgi:hypothetical protein
MRDDHLKSGHSHATDPGSSGTTPLDKLDNEELQPLMFDLIETDRVEIVTSLIPRLRNFNGSVQSKIAIHAAKVGSHSILQLFSDTGFLTEVFAEEGSLDWAWFGDLAKSAVESESVRLSKILLCWVATLDLRKVDKYYFRRGMRDIISTLMAVDCKDLFELWRPIVASGFGTAGTSVEVAKAFAVRSVIATTNNIPSRERRLLGIWEEYNVLDTMNTRDRYSILPRIADSSCSVNLARYAFQHGCGVDIQPNKNSPTALQFASRKTTKEAAYLMEFLLLQGADPNKSMGKMRIGDEKGAREISKWLGLTWEQLVERTTQERQRQE